MVLRFEIAKYESKTGVIVTTLLRRLSKWKLRSVRRSGYYSSRIFSDGVFDLRDTGAVEENRKWCTMRMYSHNRGRRDGQDCAFNTVSYSERSLQRIWSVGSVCGLEITGSLLNCVRFNKSDLIYRPRKSCSSVIPRSLLVYEVPDQDPLVDELSLSPHDNDIR